MAEKREERRAYSTTGYRLQICCVSLLLLPASDANAANFKCCDSNYAKCTPNEELSKGCFCY